MLLHKRLQGRNPALPRALLFPLVLLLLRLLFKLIKKYHLRLSSDNESLSTEHTPTLLEMPNCSKIDYFNEIAGNRRAMGDAVVRSQYEPLHSVKICATVWKTVCPGLTVNPRETHWTVPSDGNSLAAVAEYVRTGAITITVAEAESGEGGGAGDEEYDDEPMNASLNASLPPNIAQLLAAESYADSYETDGLPPPNIPIMQAPSNPSIPPNLPSRYRAFASLLSLSYSLFLQPLIESLHEHALGHLSPDNILPLLAMNLHLHHHHSHLLPCAILRSARSFLSSLLQYFAKNLALVFGTDPTNFPLLPTAYHAPFNRPLLCGVASPDAAAVKYFWAIVSEHAHFIFSSDAFVCPELYLYTVLLHSPLPRTTLGCVRAGGVPRAILQGYVERTAGNGREGVYRGIVHPEAPPRACGRLWGGGEAAQVDVEKSREEALKMYKAGAVMQGFEENFEGGGGIDDSFR
jgi:hypothetical protein